MAKAKRKDEEVILVIGEKAYRCSRKYANAAITLAKQKFANRNAILAVEKPLGGVPTITLKKDFYDDEFKMLDELFNWEKGGYTVSYTRQPPSNQAK